MSRKLKPITQLEKAVRHLRKQKEYAESVKKGHYSFPLSPEKCQENIDHARIAVDLLVESFSATSSGLSLDETRAARI